MRPKADFEKSHIPGARWVDIKAFQNVSRPENFADRSAWDQALVPLAISPDSEVYVYDDARQHDAARIWWLLSYAGVERVGLVDGGFSLWERQHRPVNSESPAAQPTRLDIRFHASRVANRADVQAAIDKEGTQLVDARSEAQYRGETQPSDGGPAGHIPSARSLDGYDLVDADGRFLDVDAQRARLAKAELAADRPIIVYSQAGSRSALVVFALERLGIHARHYFHGVPDWSKGQSAPFVLGARPRQAQRADPYDVTNPQADGRARAQARARPWPGGPNGMNSVPPAAYRFVCTCGGGSLNREHSPEACLAAHHAVVGLRDAVERINLGHRPHAGEPAEIECILRVDGRSGVPPLDRPASHEQQYGGDLIDCAAPRIKSVPLTPRPPWTATHRVTAGYRGQNDLRTTQLLELCRWILSLAVDVRRGAQLAGQALLVRAARDADGVKAHLGGVLYAEMPQAAEPEDGDHVARPRTAVPQRIECCQTGTHQRGRFDRRQVVRHRATALAGATKYSP